MSNSSLCTPTSTQKGVDKILDYLKDFQLFDFERIMENIIEIIGESFIDYDNIFSPDNLPFHKEINDSLYE